MLIWAELRPAGAAPRGPLQASMPPGSIGRALRVRVLRRQVDAGGDEDGADDFHHRNRRVQEDRGVHEGEDDRQGEDQGGRQRGKLGRRLVPEIIGQRGRQGSKDQQRQDVEG